MITIKVATENRVKIEAITEAFEYYFKNVHVMRYDVKSGVPDQPLNKDVFKGAQNRIKELAKKEDCNWDYLVSCEAGLINLYGYWFNVQVVMIQSKEGKFGVGVSQGVQIPPKHVNDIIHTSITNVLEKVFGRKGGINLLTYGRFTRKRLIEDATIMALTRILNGNEW